MLHSTRLLVVYNPVSLVDAHNPLVLNLSVDLSVRQAIDLGCDLPAEDTDASVLQQPPSSNYKAPCTFHVCAKYKGTTPKCLEKQHLQKPA